MPRLPIPRPADGRTASAYFGSGSSRGGGRLVRELTLGAVMSSEDATGAAYAAAAKGHPSVTAFRARIAHGGASRIPGPHRAASTRNIPFLLATTPRQCAT